MNSLQNISKLLHSHLRVFFVLTMLLPALISDGQQENASFYHDQDPLNPEYLQGEMIIKINPEAEFKIEKSTGKIETGIDNIDRWFSFYQVTEMDELLPSSHSEGEKALTKKGISSIFHVRFELSMDPVMFCDALNQDPNIVYAEPVYKIYSLATYPNDALYQSGEQWYLDEINAPSAWDSTTCDTTQVIAIIDSGVDWEHPDLDGNIWSNREEIPGNGFDDDGNGYIDDIRGWDFTSNSNDPDDDNGHGTHVAGIAAAETDNYVGVAGVAWNARIMPLKVLTGTGQGNTAWLTSAIYYAANNGATVVNMSLGTYGESQAVKDALLHAYDTLTLIGAAGNDNVKVDTLSPPNQAYAPMFPGCYPFVIGVEAGTPSGTIASFSNFDPSGFSETANPEGYNYEIIAPGIDIFSTFPGGGYRSLTGTSMASPIVAGAVALIKDFNPGIANEEVFARLIQFAQAGHLKIPNALHGRLEPDIFFVNRELVDTVGDADNDGHADSDEVFDMWFTVKNAGGYADSVWAKLRLHNPEDTTLASILDSTSYIGDLDSAGFHNEIPAYTTLTGERDPFRVYIKPDVINEHDITFEYEIGAKNGSPVSGTFYLTIQNGEELHGLLDTTFTLTPDKLWLVNQSFKITNTGALHILPGTHLKINSAIIQNGTINAFGTKDSLIYIFGPQKISAQQHNTSFSNFAYTVFEGFGGFTGGHVTCDYCKFHSLTTSVCKNSGFDFKHCVITNTTADAFNWGGGSVEYCNFDNIPGGVIGQSGTASHCNFVNRTGPFIGVHVGLLYKNNFITSHGNAIYPAHNGPDYDYIQEQYWGTTRNDLIDEMIIDFWDNPTLPLAIYKPFLIAPNDSAHGVVWKVHLNNIDPQDEYLDPIGVGLVKFDVFFNKPMDTYFQPLLTFGVRDPLTQHVVENNAFWSSDSMIWTAYYDIDPSTGDGMNYLRVANAVDTAGFVIPNENTMRFSFNIQAASSNSIQFMATPGIGKVFLEWPYDYTEDFLGYNMYRFEKIDENTTTDTLLINEQLINDSTWVDYGVIPDSTYYYCYKIVGTDMKESGYSKVISAKPLSTANGDANGDESLNVLDITAIISYILQKEPQPFLFEAADVNYDGQVNVLDIVLIIQMINGDRDLKLQTNRYEPEYLFLTDTGLYLESKGQIAALQFELKGVEIRELKLLSKMEGFEFNYTISEGKIYGIIFSYQRDGIREGMVRLLDIIPSDTPLTWSGFFASDPYGNAVPLDTLKPEYPHVPQYQIMCSPNPFSDITQFSFELPDDANYIFRIFNLEGVQVFEEMDNKSSSQVININWDSRESGGKELSPGVFVGNLIIKTGSGYRDQIESSIKVIKMKR